MISIHLIKRKISCRQLCSVMLKTGSLRAETRLNRSLLQQPRTPICTRYACCIWSYWFLAKRHQLELQLMLFPSRLVWSDCGSIVLSTWTERIWSAHLDMRWEMAWCGACKENDLFPADSHLEETVVDFGEITLTVLEKVKASSLHLELLKKINSGN